LNSRVKELEAQREPSNTLMADNTPKQQQQPQPAQIMSKIPLPASVNASTKKPLQPPNPASSPFPRTPSNTSKLQPNLQQQQSANVPQPSPSTPITPLPYPPESNHKLDPNLVAQIENALVSQLRSLQLKLNTSESQRQKVMERVLIFERECGVLRGQNEKLAGSESELLVNAVPKANTDCEALYPVLLRHYLTHHSPSKPGKLNEKIWDLEILHQQLQETNETLQKEITRHVQKIKSLERDISSMKDQFESVRAAESVWLKEKQTLVFKMESESNRKRREIAILKREKGELERQIEELSRPEQVFMYKASGTTVSSSSDLTHRAKSPEPASVTITDSDSAQQLLLQQQQQRQLQLQHQKDNDLFLSSLSKALSQAHSQNQELRKENADLTTSNQELDRLLQEANETIESLKVGCDLTSLDRVGEQAFDPSFMMDHSVLSLHNQLSSSESLEDLLKFDSHGDENLVQMLPTNLLAEMTQVEIEVAAPAAEATNSPTVAVEGTAESVVEVPLANERPQPVMSDFCCQTDDTPLFTMDSRSILNELIELDSFAASPGFIENASFDDEVSFSESFGSSIRSGAGGFSIAEKDVESIQQNNPNQSILGQMNTSTFQSALQRTGVIRTRSPELVNSGGYTGPGMTRHRSEISFDHQTQEYVQYDSTAIEALTATMIGTWFQKPNRHGKKPQLRFFWVNPYSRLLNWSHSATNSTGKGITKTAYIKQMKWLEPGSETHKNYPPDETHAIEIISRTRSIFMIPLTWQDHKAWTTGLSLLLSKSGDTSSGGGNRSSNNMNENPLPNIPLHERFKIVDMESPVRRGGGGGGEMNGGTPLRRSFTQAQSFMDREESFESSMSPARAKTPTPRMVPSMESLENERNAGVTTPTKDKDRKRGFSRLGFTPLRLSSTRSGGGGGGVGGGGGE
ncbi:UNVERIFIED_CONTAM: hypothetical protein HDU68_002132, partial [Siphonaria sp. JEL0065]